MLCRTYFNYIWFFVTIQVYGFLTVSLIFLCGCIFGNWLHWPLFRCSASFIRFYIWHRLLTSSVSICVRRFIFFISGTDWAVGFFSGILSYGSDVWQYQIEDKCCSANVFNFYYQFKIGPLLYLVFDVNQWISENLYIQLYMDSISMT